MTQYLFQPAHCPELNPIERVWEHLKDCLAWQLFDDLDALKATVSNILNSWKRKTLKNLTGWNYILQALFVAGI